MYNSMYLIWDVIIFKEGEQQNGRKIDTKAIASTLLRILGEGKKERESEMGLVCKIKKDYF